MKLTAIVRKDGIAPFGSATLVSPEKWGLDEKTPFARNMLQFVTPFEMHADDIIKEIKLDKTKGVILGGMDWMLQIDDFLEMLKYINMNHLKVMIMTPYDLNTFYLMLGEHLHNKLDPEDIDPTLPFTGEDFERHCINVGMNTLDALIEGRYVISAGIGEPKMYVIEDELGDEDGKN